MLVNRPLRPEVQERHLSVFADDRWNLTPALHDLNAKVSAVTFDKVPERFRLHIKHFAWLLINDRGPQRRAFRMSVDRPAIRTVVSIVRHVREFAIWLQVRGVERFVDVTQEDLDHYLEHVNANEEFNLDQRMDLLSGVRWYWSRRDALLAEARLPEWPPWHGEKVQDLVGRRTLHMTNRTHRISPDTMEALLLWSLRFVECFADDITRAYHEFVTLSARTPRARRARGTSPARYGSTQQQHELVKQQLEELLSQLKAKGFPLPGRRQPDGGLSVNYPHLGRLLNTAANMRYVEGYHRIIEASGLPIGEATYLYQPVTGTLQGRPWRSTLISYHEAPVLARLLSAACFVVIAYLSGMRTGEMLNLRRGCATFDASNDLWLITGHHSKGVVDQDGNTKAEGEIRPDPWTVIDPVATAIGVLEQLHDYDILFPTTLNTEGNVGETVLGQRTGLARDGAMIKMDIAQLIAWVNDYCAQYGLPEAIPADRDNRPITIGRFRRTLAWFIARKPRGLVAAAIQYGHVHVKMTLGYSGTYDSGFPDELAFEQWLHRIEQLVEADRRLQAGEHVSGPAADAYKQRVQLGATKFSGRVLRTSREARDLLGNPDIQVVQGLGMTCVPDPDKALCQMKFEEDNARFTPDLDDCRPRCGNIARTDGDIDEIKQKITELRVIVADALAPTIRHQREQHELKRLERLVIDHEQSRQRTPTE
ncbi:hypothetical protein ABT061_43340 [Streptosporangium sp. NPDC002544]|uniref:hypothetical protein n=1 Tax=Streptosporangium sp. NPDC002544 TaxID=3154538 RepID=UPI003327A672